MDKTLESTLKVSINTTLPACDDKGVFTMMMTHTGNTSSLQCQEVVRRKGTKEVVVIFVSKRFVNEIIMIIIKHLKKLDYQRS